MKMKIGLALSGGAARGIAHIGVLKALKEAQIPIDMVAGASSGALIGALYASGLDIGTIERVALGLKWREFADFTLPRMGLISGKGIEEFVSEHTKVKEFGELRIPLAIITTDLTTERGVVFREGPLARIVQASCSIPGVYTPVKHENMLLVDGGIINILPTDVLREMGADFVIGVDVNTKATISPEPKNVFQVILQSWDVISRQGAKRAAKDADIVIYPEIGDISKVDLKRARELLQAGYQATQEVIPRLKREIRKRQGIIYRVKRKILERRRDERESEVVQ
jgi:NTE family protein